MSDGLAPWDYRTRLADSPSPFTATSAKGSTTLEFIEPSPILGIALHHSHRVRPELAERMVISPVDRWREEDPETHRFIRSTTHRLTPNQSRYEVDMNRPPDTAVYLSPEMAWGNQIWREKPTPDQLERTQEKWYEHHTLIDAAVQDAIERFGQAIVLDIHSYNYQRDGPTAWRTDGQPCINLGTEHLDLDEQGRELVDWFLAGLEGHTLLGEEMLVQENAVFQGGYLNRRLSRTYGPRCITLSVEYKKVYMDELTGQVLEAETEDLARQFDETLGALAERLGGPLLDKPRLPETVGSQGPLRASS